MRATVLLSILSVTSCASDSAPRGAVPLVETGAPSGIAHTQDTRPGQGDVPLFRQTWSPSEGAPRAVLVVVHGLKDHSSRYAELAHALVPQGFAVVGFDLRGHGRSGGERVVVETFDEYIADLTSIVDDARAQYAGLPIFVLGHSMGGAITTLYALSTSTKPAGIVLSAPALKPGDDVSGFLIFVTGVLGTVAPGLGVLDLPNEKFSRDAAVVEDMGRDPLITQEPGPARTADELLGALARIEAEGASLDVPFLVMHGSDDVITNPEGSRSLHARAKAVDKTLSIFDGLWHDLMHEPERARVRTTVVDWLVARAGGPTPTTDNAALPAAVPANEAEPVVDGGAPSAP